MTTTLERLIQRTADAADDDLAPGAPADARRTLTAALEAHVRDDHEAEAALLAPLARRISDSWPHTSALGRDVLGYVQAVRR
ncbi:hypothetical protein EDF35_2291 [Rathayibacter sp. PhB151]|uniref:hypothetical protein n=1 Tax=Rathayibacter sp. PhB151 TaxID=2485189 RepID=UPI0010626F48|nr:hypothetical protein [Rathayibacter sp. PhB151]TDX79064.1 hypothetical protein EDF35_2291 [Rathayibacter sp. PhB151]